MGGDGFRIVNRPPDDFMPCQEQWYSVGVHPWALQQGEVRQETWEKLREAAVHPQVLAVGEAGLDRLVQVPMKLQEAVFARQAELAGEAGKPLIVHLVRAVDELLRLKKALKPGGVGGGTVASRLLPLFWGAVSGRGGAGGAVVPPFHRDGREFHVHCRGLRAGGSRAPDSRGRPVRSCP